MPQTIRGYNTTPPTVHRTCHLPTPHHHPTTYTGSLDRSRSKLFTDKYVAGHQEIFTKSTLIICCEYPPRRISGPPCFRFFLRFSRFYCFAPQILIVSECVTTGGGGVDSLSSSNVELNHNQSCVCDDARLLLLRSVVATTTTACSRKLNSSSSSSKQHAHPLVVHTAATLLFNTGII